MGVSPTSMLGLCNNYNTIVHMIGRRAPIVLTMIMTIVRPNTSYSNDEGRESLVGCDEKRHDLGKYNTSFCFTHWLLRHRKPWSHLGIVPHRTKRDVRSHKTE